MRARRRHDLAAGHLRSGAEPDLRHAPATRSRSSRTTTARATTSSPARSSRSIPTPARWRGTSSRRRTTRTTGTRRRRRSSFDGADQRPAAQAHRAGRAQRLLLRARPRRPARHLVTAEFVKTNWSLGFDAEGQPIPNPAKKPQHRRRARVAEPGRRDQLAAAELQPARPGSSMSTRHAPSACITSTIQSDNPQGWGGTDRGGCAEAMLQAIDYQTARSAGRQVGRRAPRRPSEHGRQRRLHRRSGQHTRRPERHHGRRAVARGPERSDQQRSDHLYARRHPIRRRRRRRHALVVRDELAGFAVTSIP